MLERPRDVRREPFNRREICEPVPWNSQINSHGTEALTQRMKDANGTKCRVLTAPPSSVYLSGYRSNCLLAGKSNAAFLSSIDEERSYYSCRLNSVSFVRNGESGM
jgi:hypothetical protein